MKSKIIISHINEIFETIATTLAYDFDDNFSDVSDDTNYFKKEEGVNKSIKEDSKNFKVIIKAGDNDDMYFYSKEKEKKETNEIKTDDDNSFNYKKNSDFNDTESINSNHLIYNIILHKEIV